MAPIESLRAAAAGALRAAIEAVRPEQLVAGAVRFDGRALTVRGHPLPPARERRVVVALGKAAGGLAAGWQAAAPGWATELWLLTPHGVSVPPVAGPAVRVRRGGHPLPDRDGEAATRELLALAAELGSEDAMVVLLSGGTSALLAAPVEGVGLADVVAVTRGLLGSGAAIGELNTVRRALLAAAGGGLARAAWPAPVTTLVLSDVVAGGPADIGSGPTVPSPTTAEDALAVLTRRALRDQVPPTLISALLRQIAAPPAPAGHWFLLADNRTAVMAAAAALERAGAAVSVALRPLVGEASRWGRVLGSLARAMTPRDLHAVVLGGETTVTVRGGGQGGRSREIALAAALSLEGVRGRVVLAAGTDGVDGLGDAAGAMVDGGSAARIVAAGRDPVADLADNDSGPSLAAAGDALVTGPTGTNVADLVLVLASART